MTLRDRVDLVRDKDLTLGTLLERLAVVHGNIRLAQESGEDGLLLTYDEGADLVARLASGIAEKVSPGDRVVIATPNSYGLFLATLAASRAGAGAVPVSPKMSEGEIEHVVEDSGAALVIHDLAEVERDEPL